MRKHHERIDLIGCYYADGLHPYFTTIEDKIAGGSHPTRVECETCGQLFFNRTIKKSKDRLRLRAAMEMGMFNIQEKHKVLLTVPVRMN